MGAIRTPFVQKQLENFAGSSKKIRTNVNADEAAVSHFNEMGYVAASPVRISLTRKLGLRAAPLKAAPNTAGPEKQVTVKNLEDFEFSFAQHLAQDEEQPILGVQSTGLRRIVNFVVMFAVVQPKLSFSLATDAVRFWVARWNLRRKESLKTSRVSSASARRMSRSPSAKMANPVNRSPSS
jgi:hypothetical protein